MMLHLDKLVCIIVGGAAHAYPPTVSISQKQV